LSRLCSNSALLSFITIGGLLLGSSQLAGQNVGADPAACLGGNSVCTHHLQTYSFVSLTEGNVAETYSVARAAAAFGPTLTFDLIYNSYNADGTRTSIDTGMGYGWTHTYNDYLFMQGADIFRWRGDGRITKFSFVNGSYQATPGYFETLASQSESSVIITDKYQTQYQYRLISRTPQDPPPPGSPIGASGDLFRLVSITDRNLNVTTLAYSDGYLTTVTDTYGRSLTLAYNATHHLASVTDPLGQVTNFSYTSTPSLLTAIKDPLNHTTNYTYNNDKQIATKTDRDGRLFTIAYRSSLPFSEVDSSGGVVYSLANSSNWSTDPIQLSQNYIRAYIPSTTTRTDGRGNAWQYKYESHGFVLSVSAPDGATTKYTYDPATLRPASKTDADGNSTSYRYDSQGNLVQLVDADGNITSYTYDSHFSQVTSMTDPQGRITRYTLDSFGNRISETDPLGDTKSWTYDSHGNILTETDKNGNTTSYAYDIYGNQSRRVDALQEATGFVYDIIGDMTTVTDANNHSTSYKYDSLYRLTLVTDALNGTKQYVYDGEDDKTVTTDENGNSTNYAYDQRRRLITTTDALNNSTTNAYDADNNRISMTDFNGHATLYTFDVQDRLVSATDALGYISSCSYDPVGNKVSETDGNGHTTTFVFDALNRKTRMTDALDESTTWSYDLTGLPGCPQCTGPTLGSNLPTEQVDANGKIIYWAFDGLDRLVINIHKQGGTAYLITASDAVNRHRYDANSNHISMTEPNGNSVTYVYDVLNRQIQMVNAAGDTTKTAYDPVGNVSSITLPNLNVTTSTYDADNRPLQQSDSAGIVGKLTLDPAGNITSVTDGNGYPIIFGYDRLNRVISTKDPLCVTHSVCRPIEFTYDPEGNELSTTDRNGNLEAYSYDAINRPVSVTNSLGSTSQSHYDGVANVVGMVDGNGHTTTVTYDAVNRPISETYADQANNTVTWTYDKVGHVTSRTDQRSQVTAYTYSDLYFVTTRAYSPGGGADTFTYDLSGRLLTETHDGWTDMFTYDAASRVLSSVQNGRSVSYAYNVPGRSRTLTYPGGRTITEQLDPRSRISTVNDGGVSPIVQYAYDQANNVHTRAFRNGTLATYTYNPNNWILSVEHTLGSARLLGFQYTYDAEGNQVSQNKLNAPTDSESFTSNPIYQLTDYKTGVLVNGQIPSPVTQTIYTLDPVGNWEKTISSSLGGTRTQTRTHSPSNEITSINGLPLMSDSNGNLSDDGTELYFYDQENRLVKAVDKASLQILGQYRYDAAGRRVSTVDNFGVQTFYYYDGMRTIEEESAAGVTTATYVFGNYVDEALTMDRVLEGGNQTFYYHQNAVHSVFALTNSTGGVVEAYEYDAYGSQTVILPGRDGIIHYDARDLRVPGGKSSYGNPFLFTGQRYDPETGLMYYKQRYYSPELGRFMSRDPIGIWGDPANIGNGYAYVGDNPATWTDPYGGGFWKWVRKTIKSVEAAAKSVAKTVEKIAATVAKVATSAAKSITADLIKTVADVIGQVQNIGGYLATAGGLLAYYASSQLAWIQSAINWVAEDAVPFITKFINNTVVAGIFTAASCYSFATEVVDIATHGLQPTSIPSFLGAVGINTNTPVNIYDPQGTLLASPSVGDVVTIASDVSDGISCGEGLVDIALLF
jgi:RHS repeat-associated protein